MGYQPCPGASRLQEAFPALGLSWEVLSEQAGWVMKFCWRGLSSRGDGNTRLLVPARCAAVTSEPSPCHSRCLAQRPA